MSQQVLPVQWKPKVWVAVLLGFFLQWMAFLYLTRVKLAVVYILLGLVVFFLDEKLLDTFPQSFLLEYFSVNLLLSVICSVHAGIVSAKIGTLSVRPWYSRWWGFASIIFSIIISILVLRSFFFEPFYLPSGAMFPSLQIGDHVVIKKWPYGNYGTFGISIYRADEEDIKSPERGDMFVFDFPLQPETKYVKRIIGLPGDQIEYIDKQLIINGEAVKREMLEDSDRMVTFLEYLDGRSHKTAYTKAMPPQRPMRWTVPDNHYFVMGDNRDNSQDSRIWGFLPRNHLVGKVVYIW